MKILLLTNHFHPEDFRCNDIAFTLADNGHQVKVLTAIPDYPQGHFHKGYSFLRKRVETINGVSIVRVPIIPRGDGSKMRMILNYASSTLSFVIYSLWQAIFHKYDIIYIHETSPAFICIPALVIKWLRRTPIVLWILDMWPDSLIAGGINSKKIHNAVGDMMKMIYRHCDKIQISSRGFSKLLEERGLDKSVIEYFPNWSDEAITNSNKIFDPQLPEGFKIMFAGNLGEAQNLENVMQAALKLKSYKQIKWIFLGDGRKKSWMEHFIAQNELHDNVFMLGRHPLEEMPSYFSKADVMLVSLSDHIVFNNTLPAKVQAYMSCGKPILGFLNGEGQEIIKVSGCGCASNASDVDDFIANVLHLNSLPTDKLLEYGRKGYDFYMKEFNKELLMQRLMQSLQSVSKR